MEIQSALLSKSGARADLHSFRSIGLFWALSRLAAIQRVELRPSPESSHSHNRDDLAFSSAWPSAPTFGCRKPSFE
jgi:hypothetical protein